MAWRGQLIGEECPDLEELNVCGAKKASAAAVHELLTRCNPPGKAATPPPIVGAYVNLHVYVMTTEEGKRSRSAVGGRKRLRRLKIRYLGSSKAALEAVEAAFAKDVEFLT